MPNRGRSYDWLRKPDVRPDRDADALDWSSTEEQRLDTADVELSAILPERCPLCGAQSRPPEQARGADVGSVPGPGGATGRVVE